MGFSASDIADILRAASRTPLKSGFTSAIIVAAGSGTRMGDIGVTKQMIPVAGIPVAARSLIAFQNCPDIDEIIVAARKEETDTYAVFREKYGISKLSCAVVGGDTRQESVFLAFRKVSENSEYVAIHDAARCCITPDQISEVVRSAYRTGASAAACRSYDTVKTADRRGYVTGTLDRDEIWLISTPQVVKTSLYRACAYYSREKGIRATDDCGLLEACGYRMKLCDIGRTNIKITEKSDILLAESIIERQKESE